MSAIVWALGIVALILAALARRKLARPSLGGDLGRIPGPADLPFFGTGWTYLWRYRRDKVHEAYADMIRRYGPVCRERIADGRALVSVADREDIERVLRYPSRYPFRPPSEIVTRYRKERPDRYASAGIASEQGEVWHALRTKLTGELTSRRTLLAFLPELNAIADDLLRLVSAGADARGNVARFDELASRYGIETCCALVLGRRMSFMESEISATARQLGDAMNRRFLSERDSFYRSSVDAYVSSPDYLKFLESEDVIHRIISSIVEESRASDGQGANDTKCILTSIVGRRDLDEREKHSALVDFIAAGISTLSSSLTFLFYLLSKNPAAQTKIREELEEIAPNRSHVTAADLGGMNYAKACMLEAFRLVPVAFALTRVLEEDAPLGGYLVPAGTLVMCHTMIACRDERNFERAGEFRPERWLEADGRGRGATTCVFAPFGIGKRMCPGKRLVEQAILITLAKTVRDYVVEFDGEIDVQFEFVLAPKTPVAFRFRQRR